MRSCSCSFQCCIFLTFRSFSISTSRALLRAWKRQEMPRRATPLTSTELFAMCGAALRQNRPVFAAALCMAFHGLLRVNELLSIRPVDWVPSPSGRTAILSLPTSKGFSRTGNVESVVFSDPVLIRWFSSILSTLPLNRPVLGLTYPQFSSISSN